MCFGFGLEEGLGLPLGLLYDFLAGFLRLYLLLDTPRRRVTLAKSSSPADVMPYIVALDGG